MSTVSSVNVAIAFLVAQQSAEQAALEEIARLREENAKLALAKSKTKVVKAKRFNGSQAAPAGNLNSITGLALPPKGSLTAESFMLAMRDAGKRSVQSKDAEGVEHTIIVRQDGEIRNDQIRAIAGFVGFDNRLPFGSQDHAARMMAQRLLAARPMVGPSRSEEKRADLSARGFVAGMPAPVSAKLSDLQAREIMAIDAMLAHRKEADDMSRSAEDRQLSAGLAMVEGERASSIREDIRRLTF
jgi:hypothetical protein